MDKELALAIDFKKAPAELQAAATAHYANVKALARAQAKVVESTTAVEAAKKAHDETAKTLRLALKAWEPEAGQ